MSDDMLDEPKRKARNRIAHTSVGLGFTPHGRTTDELYNANMADFCLEEPLLDDTF